MVRLDFDALMKMAPFKIRTLKEINEETGAKKLAIDLILQAVRMQPGANADKIISITGYTRTTIGKKVNILQKQKLITKVFGKGGSNNPNAFFYPVEI